MEENKIKLSFCSPNNATGNSKSERINRQINEIMRIFYRKNTTITIIKETIENRLNLVYHRTLHESPTYIAFKKSLFTNKNEKDYEESLSIANSNSEKINVKEMTKINKKRKEFIYNIGEQIFYRNRTSIKQEKIWLGPFDIVENLENRLKIRVNNGLKIINIKNARPYLGGGRMLYHRDHNTISDQ